MQRIRRITCARKRKHIERIFSLNIVIEPYSIQVLRIILENLKIAMRGIVNNVVPLFMFVWHKLWSGTQLVGVQRIWNVTFVHSLHLVS